MLIIPVRSNIKASMITVAAGIFRTTDCAAGFMGAVAKQALARYGIVIGAHINNVGEIFDRKFDPLGEDAELLMSLRQKEFAVLDDVRGAEMQALILEARERQDSIGGSIECMALNLPAG